ncbi:MAG TPA: TIGR03936 family radical SAM-associated protein [Pseudonocardiaceae bacterium]|jgi:radical SAM-linked protein
MPPRPSDPPVQRIRLRYAKRGRLRFASHRDVARAFERALRAAGVPMAYSQGFSPHPRVSWIGAAPTGAASEAEYVEIQVVRRLDPEAVRRELDAALPDGLDVLAAAESDGGSLAGLIEVSRWRIEVPGVPSDELARAAAALMAAPSVPVEKLTKDGRRTVDARAALVSADVAEGTEGPEACGILSTVVRQVTPAVRPDDVLNALVVVAGVRPTVPAKATRTAQGRLDDDGCIVDPLQNVDD